MSSVTREQAEAVLAAVKEKFAAYCTTFPVTGGRMDFDAEPVPLPEECLPRLVEDYRWGDGPGAPFAVVWEEGPFEWALQELEGETVDEEATAGLQEFAPGRVLRHRAVGLPEGVLVEPVTGSVLGVYPA